MSDKLFSQRPQVGHAFLNAMWILGLVAAIQIVAVVWALIKRHSEDRFSSPQAVPAVKVNLSSDPSSSATPVVIIPGNAITIPGQEEGVPKVELEPVPSRSKISRSKSPDLSGIKDQVGVVKDPLVSRLVQSGIQDRNKANYAGALNALLDAEREQPEHPAILSQIAATHQEMGNLSEAEIYWEKVKDLGPILGGGYFEVADRVLKGENPFQVKFAPHQMVKLGSVTVEKQSPGLDGEWVKLTIPIIGNVREASGGIVEGPQVARLKVQVFFYDLINGSMPGPTTAEIHQNFPSKPYDWADQAAEFIEVIYHQPVFTVEEKQFKGDRVYFGYVIDVYYGGSLQDSVESSPELTNLRFPLNETKQEPPVQPGPDGSLFPRSF